MSFFFSVVLSSSFLLASVNWFPPPLKMKLPHVELSDSVNWVINMNRKGKKNDVDCFPDLELRSWKSLCLCYCEWIRTFRKNIPSPPPRSSALWPCSIVCRYVAERRSAFFVNVKLWRWMRYVPSKARYLPTPAQGVISQKTRIRRNIHGWKPFSVFINRIDSPPVLKIRCINLSY